MLGFCMSKLRSLKRGLIPRKIAVALMMKKLVNEAGSMSALRADFEGVVGRTLKQRTVETFEPARPVEGAV